MSEHDAPQDAQTSADDRRSVDSDPRANPQQDGSPRTKAPRARSLLLWSVMGALGGLTAWLLIEYYGGRFQLPEGTIPGPERQMQMMGDREKVTEVQKLLRTIRYKNTALGIGLFGLAVGGFLGLAAGIARKSPATVAVGTATGALLGAAFGAIGGYAAEFVGEQAQTIANLETMYRTLAMHALAFVLVGIAAGAAVGLPTYRMRAIGCSIGRAAAAALIAAVLYLPIGALLVLFTNSSQDRAIPEGTLNRLCWTMLPAIMIGLFVGGLGRDRSPEERAGSSA